MKWSLVGTVGIVILAAGVQTSGAQPPGPPPRPAFSPYLNLARSGGTAAQNYYGLVRPEMQFRQSIQTLQGTVAANQQAIGALQPGSGADALPTTGHASQFLNYGGFFLTADPSAGSPGAAGGRGGAFATGRPGGTGAVPARGGRR